MQIKDRGISSSPLLRLKHLCKSSCWKDLQECCIAAGRCHCYIRKESFNCLAPRHALTEWDISTVKQDWSFLGMWQSDMLLRQQNNTVHNQIEWNSDHCSHCDSYGRCRKNKAAIWRNLKWNFFAFYESYIMKVEIIFKINLTVVIEIVTAFIKIRNPEKPRIGFSSNNDKPCFLGANLCLQVYFVSTRSMDPSEFSARLLLASELPIWSRTILERSS